MIDRMIDPENFIELPFVYTHDHFTVFFYGNCIFIEGNEYPIGQCGVDVLNLDDRFLLTIDRRMLDFYYAVQHLLDEDTEEAAYAAQEKLWAAWELVSTLPVYRDFEINWKWPLIQDFYSSKKIWAHIRKTGTEERAGFDEILRKIVGVGELLRGFRKQVSVMMDGYFEPLPRRNADAYAEGFFKFYSDMLNMNAAEYGRYDFEQAFPVEVGFVPMLSPTDESKFILAERACFSELLYFLEVEFYRALAIGNAPRKCRNCGRYFLLTSGYNTCYCNNIAPGETKRTCRKVGAHRKEAQGKSNRSPAQQEYDRTYNRLKARKQRGKISADEWNAAVAQAQKLLEQSDRGELTDDEFKAQLDAL